MSNPTTILITGANSGVGLATVKMLVETDSNFQVFLASRSLENGERAAAEVRKTSPKATITPVQLDVADTNSIKKAAALVKERYGYLDVLINNAAVATRHGTYKERLAIHLTTNTIGPAVVTEAFTPLLLKSRNARLIYVSSGLGSLEMTQKLDHNHPGLRAREYCISKAGLDMLAVLDHKELGPKGVKVWAMCPGYVTSNLRGKGRDDVYEEGALPASTSAETLLGIINGKEDANVGKFVHKAGVYPW